MANLTAWEKFQLQHLHLLLEQASKTLKDFESKDESLHRNESYREDEGNTEDWLKFRGFTSDLCSVLDYTYFLLYSHFTNKGVPDHSFKVASKCGFPYKRSGVKTSDSDQDQSKKFVTEKLKFLFADKLGESTHFWKDIGDIILSVQPKLLVGSDGNPVDEMGQPTDNSNPIIITLDQTSFAILHYFRNCCTHRDLIHFLPEESWVEINQTTREIKLVKKRQEREGFYYYTLGEGYWIHLPEGVIGTVKDDRLFLEVLHQLFEFVKRITSKLLSSALLLSPRYILEHHFDGNLEVTNRDTVDRRKVVDIMMILRYGRKFTVTSNPYKELRDAEQDGCIQLLCNMVREKLLPTSPHTHLTPYHVYPFPCVSISQQANYRVLANVFKQILKPQKMVVTDTLDGPHCVDNEAKLYQASYKFRVVDTHTDKMVFELCSHVHEKVCNNNEELKQLKEAAVKEVMEESILLGIKRMKI